MTSKCLADCPEEKIDQILDLVSKREQAEQRSAVKPPPCKRPEDCIVAEGIALIAVAATTFASILYRGLEICQAPETINLHKDFIDNKLDVVTIATWAISFGALAVKEIQHQSRCRNHNSFSKTSAQALDIAIYQLAKENHIEAPLHKYPDTIELSDHAKHDDFILDYNVQAHPGSPA